MNSKVYYNYHSALLFARSLIRKGYDARIFEAYKWGEQAKTYTVRW